MKSLMNGGPELIRQYMPFATRDMVEQFLQNTDLLRFGGDLLQSAAFHGKADVVDLLIERGADVYNSPDIIQGDDSYRKTPHVITACLGGDIKTLESVLRAGGGIQEKGFICFSKKKKNLVISNVIGAAAHAGKTKLLEHLLQKLSSQAANFEASEEQDRTTAKDTKFVNEMVKYTPLMLAVAKGDENLDCVKLLLKFKVDYMKN